ncbi:MAG: 30S ribosomal protein S27ae [Candidatus Alkanophagales archaeon]
MGRGKTEARAYRYYEVRDGKLVRRRRPCPRCGEGVFLAEHPDRRSCGKCGYTEFKPSR